MAYYCGQCGYRASAPSACPHHHVPLLKPPFGSMLGEPIGNYVVVGELGSGGMGVVYRAINPMIRTEVAVKVLQASSASDADAVTRLLREAQVVNRIASPNVPKVTDAGVLSDGRPYLVMELLVGESLGKLLQATPRPPIPDVCRLMIDVLEVVAAAHQATIIHRDLKPENVFVTAAGRTVVLDFGIAKLLDPQGGSGLTSTGSSIGTPGYMAPEQIRGEGVDARTDLYAASVMLYEMLAGRRPFLGTDFDVLSAHCDRRPAPPRTWFPEIPIDLQSIVLTGLAKDPAQRFQTAQAMRTALGHVARQLQ